MLNGRRFRLNLSLSLCRWLGCSFGLGFQLWLGVRFGLLGLRLIFDIRLGLGFYL